jgi:hypothetical protein
MLLEMLLTQFIVKPLHRPEQAAVLQWMLKDIFLSITCKMYSSSLLRR